MSDSTHSDGRRTAVPRVFCRACASPLVQAVDWQREEHGRWTVCLWCPECGFERTALLERSEATRLSLALEEGFACMLESLAELATASPGACHDLAGRALSDRIEPSGERQNGGPQT